MPQPIAIRKCRRDPLPLPWENWYETVQSLQASKISYRSLCDAKVPYMYSTLPYAGKHEVIGANDYYVTGCDEYTKGWRTTFKSMELCRGKTFPLIDTSPA